jgi:hypothetical protein
MVSNNTGSIYQRTRVIFAPDNELQLFYYSYHARGRYGVELWRISDNNFRTVIHQKYGYAQDWEFYNMPVIGGGNYEIKLMTWDQYTGGPTGAGYDGVKIHAPGETCQLNPFETTTPEPPNTATHTNTPGGSTSTPTITPLVVPTKTITPYPTWTPRATWTPLPTPTPGPPQHTATSFYATVTSAAATQTPLGLTQTSAAQTATAQGTPEDTPPAATSTATDLPTATPGDPPTPTPPPQQPPGACNAQCIRPRGADIVSLAQWQEYVLCESTSYIAVCPYHAATMAAVPTMLANKEPITTFNQSRELIAGLQDIIGQYDWENTGVSGSELEPDLGIILTPQPDSIFQGGEISLSNPRDYGLICDWMIPPLIGSVLAESMCWTYNIMEHYGITPYMGLWINFMVTLMLIIYIINKWVDKTIS